MNRRAFVASLFGTIAATHPVARLMGEESQPGMAFIEAPLETLDPAVDVALATIEQVTSVEYWLKNVLAEWQRDYGYVPMVNTEEYEWCAALAQYLCDAYGELFRLLGASPTVPEAHTLKYKESEWWES